MLCFVSLYNKNTMLSLISSLCTNRCKSHFYSMKILCSKCARWQYSFWITAEPLLHHDYLIQKALTSVDIVIPRVFFQILGFQTWCLSKVKKTASWLFESLLALPLMKVFICALLLLAVEPSELALDPKGSCFPVHRGYSSYIPWSYSDWV